jgi:hypothetical protein
MSLEDNSTPLEPRWIAAIPPPFVLFGTCRVGPRFIDTNYGILFYSLEINPESLAQPPISAHVP